MNQASGKSLYNKAHDPILQAVVIFGAILIVTIGAKLVNWAGISVEQSFPWLTSTTFLLCFVIFNTVFSLAAKDAKAYWGKSIYSFIGLAILSALSAWIFSGIYISEAGSYRWIYIVVTISYLVFSAMVNVIKQIVNFAQKEEWNHPRIRKRK